MADIASLGIVIKTTGAKEATRDLKALERQSEATEKKGVALGKAFGAAIVGGLFVAGAAMKKYIANTIEAEQVQAQLEQRIKSTGGAAGLTVTELNKMAEALQFSTTFDDESIGQAQGVLLTFTKLGRDVFPRATEAVLDMSIALGTDLKSAALQVGKALNDPVKGMTALSRAGVQFSEAQTDTIKRLVETGKVAEAQQIILAELETQMGGSARAARDTLGGALQALGNSFNNLLEGDAGGGGMIETREAIEALNTALNDPGIKSAIDTIAGGVARLVAEMVGAIPHIARFSSELLGAMTQVSEYLAGRHDELMGVVMFDRQRQLAGIRRTRDAMEGPKRKFTFGSEIPNSRAPWARGAAGPDPTEDPEKPKKLKGLTDEEKAARALEQAYASLNGSMAERIALFNEESEVAQVTYDLENGALKGLDETRKQGLLAQAAELDALRERKQLEEEGKRLAESLLSPFEQINAERKRAAELLEAGVIAQEDYNRAIEAQRTPAEQMLEDMQFELELLGKTREEQELLTAARWLGAEAATEQGRAALAAMASVQHQRRDTEALVDLMDEFRSSASDALTDFVTGAESAKEAFGEFFRDMADAITRMISEQWIEKLFGQQGSTGQNTQGGGWLSAIMGLFSGSSSTANYGETAGSLADLFSGSGFGFSRGGYTGTGGVNDPAGIVHAGEVVWSQRDIARAGGVGNVEAMRQGGAPSGVSVVQHIVVQGRPNKETFRQLERASGRGAAREMSRTGR